MKHFTLPDLGEGLQEAEIIEWMVKPGDSLKADELMVIVETAKAIVEVPAPEDVTISKLCVQAGETVHVGEVLVTFESSEDEGDSGTVVGVLKGADRKDAIEVEGQNGSSISTIGSTNGSATGAETKTDITPGHRTVVHMADRQSNMRQNQHSDLAFKTEHVATASQMIAPAVRSFAHQLNINLEDLPVSDSQIVDMAYVANFYESQKRAAMSEDQTNGHNSETTGQLENGVALTGTRKLMAKAMKASHDEIPAVTLFEDVDIHDWGPKSDFTVRLLHAIVCAAKEVPVLNAWFDGERYEIEQRSDINIGIAVNAEDGLYVPVIKHAEELKVRAMRSAVNDLRQGVEAHSLKPKDMLGATITLSNFGTLAGRYATPIIVPPQVAIVGAGVVREQPVAINGELAVRRVLPLSLSFDHRAATGADAAAFLSVMIKALKQATISG